MSGKTVRRMEGKTRTSARQTKQLSVTKAIQVAFDKHGEKIFIIKGLLRRLKWSYHGILSTPKKTLKIVNYNRCDLFVKQCVLLII